MSVDDSRSISIRLSPDQVDEVVRAASHTRVPSISTLIADTLSAPVRPPSDNAAVRSQDERRAAAAAARLQARLPIGAIDPRLSRSLLRGLSILTCFTPDGPPRGILEIADELGMSPSTTHRYALTLVELGLLERSPTTRKYRLPAI